jgi:hypothetical protein
MKKREKTREKAHPTNSQVQRIKKDIRTLRDSGKSDIEIRETLGLELRTYQKYNHIIHLEDQKVWLSITQQQLASELLRLRSSLEETFKISKKMAEDPNLECGDKIEALNCMNDSRLNIIKLLVEYPDFVRKIPIISQPETDEQDSTIIPTTLKRVHT